MRRGKSGDYVVESEHGEQWVANIALFTLLGAVARIFCDIYICVSVFGVTSIEKCAIALLAAFLDPEW